MLFLLFVVFWGFYLVFMLFFFFSFLLFLCAYFCFFLYVSFLVFFFFGFYYFSHINCSHIWILLFILFLFSVCFFVPLSFILFILILGCCVSVFLILWVHVCVLSPGCCCVFVFYFAVFLGVSFLFFWPWSMACGLLVHWPGIRLGPPGSECEVQDARPPKNSRAQLILNSALPEVSTLTPRLSFTQMPTGSSAKHFTPNKQQDRNTASPISIQVA